MVSRKVSVVYDGEGDMLEALWVFREGYFTPTDDARTLKRLDHDGQVIEFLIQEISTFKQPSPVEFDLVSEIPEDDVATVPVKRTAAELGISNRRMRPLARDGRVKAASKIGQQRLMPTPIQGVLRSRGHAE